MNWKSISARAMEPVILRSEFLALILLTAIFSMCKVRGGEPPQFSVPGQEVDLAALNELHGLHHPHAFTSCTLWDTWLPLATLWTGKEPQDKYREVFLKRRIDEEGYVSMQQHRGLGHSEGWPFPTWQQAGGAGFHFSTHDEVYGLQYFGLKALTNTDGWEISGADVSGIDPIRGLQLRATGGVIRITTPPFRCGTIVAPFVRLEWGGRDFPVGAMAKVEWLMEGEATWNEARYVAVVAPQSTDGMRYANVPMHRHPGYAGVLSRYRLSIDDVSAGTTVDLKSLITAIDTRHPITNAHFIRGCCDYFGWTHDVVFLRENMVRMRKALRYALTEFRVRENHCVTVPWVGHDGRSGIVIGADGKKSIRVGLGVGGNYFDLLPFGGRDGAATIYLYDALRHFTALERAVAAHSDWEVPTESVFAAEDLATLTDAVRQAYYAKPGRGTMQGGGPAGGLGMDQEFMESVLVPQVMLYGLLGLTPEPTGFAIAPQLPKGWPSLTVSRVRLHDHEVEITAEATGRVTLKTLVSGTGPVTIRIGNTERMLKPETPGTVTGF